MIPSKMVQAFFAKIYNHFRRRDIKSMLSHRDYNLASSAQILEAAEKNNVGVIVEL